MKKTKLIEFKNQKGEILRGVLTYSDDKELKSVVMMGGFERSCTTERKFKALADELIKVGIPSLRFDHTGVGLSDGDFSTISVKNLGSDLVKAVDALGKEINFDRVSFISHSLPPCIMAEPDKRRLFEKIVMMAPALNQKDLHRFWFVTNTMKKEKPDLKIAWENYKEYLDEEAFQEFCKDPKKMTKARFVGTNYFIESGEVDYSRLVPDQPNILHVQGELDNTVPLKSLNTSFSNKIIVKDGDHDIERPDMLKQWIHKVVDFITK